jgi:hypothetical protein
MRKNLCFICKESWVPGNRCMGKGKVHYIELVLDSDEEETRGPTRDSDSNNSEEEHPHGTYPGERTRP